MEEKILNKEQLEAIQYGNGPLLIIAGAGTGKTTVITERIKWLIAKGLAKPQEILALTFTEKAAREMEERVDQVMPYGYTQMWIMTFHSFGERILRNEALHIGLNPNYKLMSETETFLLVKKNFWQFKVDYFRPSGNPYKFIEGMIQHFSRLKDEDISPTEYLKWVESQKSRLRQGYGGQAKIKNQKGEKDEETEKWLELANAYKTYEDLKVKEGVMDFGDLITNTLKLFRTRKNVLREYQEQFKYILVDEFQDTNIAQNELITLLAGEKNLPACLPTGRTGRQGNLTVVADDDQSIYRFRGAAVSNILQFQKRFPEAKIVSLTKNYRSTQEILDKAHQLIINNNPDRLEVKAGIDKRLISIRNIQGEKIQFIHTSRVEDEAEAVVKEIKKLICHPDPPAGGEGSQKDSSAMPQNDRSKESYQFKDIAILFRANAHADAFTRGLQRHGIPYQFLGPGMLFKQPEIKELICYLKFLNDPSDSVSLYRLLTMDIWGISARDMAMTTSFARRYNFTLFEVLEIVHKETLEVRSGELDNEPGNGSGNSYNQKRLFLNISQETKGKIKKIIDMIYRHLKLIPKETAGQILYYFLEDSGLLKKITEFKTTKEEKQASNISKFFDKLRQYEINHEEASVIAVCDFLNLSMELGESPLAADMDWTENNAVNLLTAHSSKGLEFPVVFLVNLVAQRFPTSLRREQIPIPENLIKEILPVGDYHLEEERRLFYVGLTRARDLLFLTASDYYGDGKRERKISPFVVETLGEEEIKRVESKKLREIKNQQLSIFDWSKPIEKKEDKPLISQYPNTLIFFLSYSQIETFKKCPLQYRYRYILRIPTPSSSAQSFGSSLHSVLRDFYRGLMMGQKLTEDDLLKLLENNWLKEGYASKTHEEIAFEKGKKTLKSFYQKGFNRQIFSLAIEQPFSFRLNDTLKVGGKIDRIDQLENGSMEIIDYKTGNKLPTQKDVDKNSQLTLYALAACDPGIYQKKPDEVKLSLYFLEKGLKLTSQRTIDQLVAAKEEILKIAEEIKVSDFPPKVSNLCEFCDFRMLCDDWK